MNCIEIPDKSPLILYILKDNNGNDVLLRKGENIKEKTVCGGKECFSCLQNCKKCPFCKKEFFWCGLSEEWGIE